MLKATLFRSRFVLRVLACGFGFGAALGAPLPENGQLCQAQIEGVTVTYSLPRPPPVRFSADGNTRFGGSSPVVLLANPVPSTTPLRIPAPASLRVPGDAPTPQSAPTSFSVDYVPAGGTDAFGEPCVAFPAEAQAVFDAACAIWANRLGSPVPITIRAGWASLEGGVLGYSGGGPTHRNFSGAPYPNTWFMATLANARAGEDLAPEAYDMHTTYGSTFAWYFGTDGNTPPTSTTS